MCWSCATFIHVSGTNVLKRDTPGLFQDQSFISVLGCFFFFFLIPPACSLSAETQTAQYDSRTMFVYHLIHLRIFTNFITFGLFNGGDLLRVWPFRATCLSLTRCQMFRCRCPWCWNAGWLELHAAVALHGAEPLTFYLFLYSRNIKYSYSSLW